MDTMTILPTLQEVEKKLGRTFTPEQTAALVDVLDPFRQMGIQRAADTRELKQGLAGLTEEVRKLTVAQARTEQRVDRLEAVMERLEVAVERLIEVQTRTEQRVDRLEAAVERLIEAQARTEQQMEKLVQAQDRTEQQMEKLVQAQDRTEQQMEKLTLAQARTEHQMNQMATTLEEIATRVGELKGWQLELKYQRRAGAYFGPLLRHLKVLLPYEIPPEMGDELDARLTPEELEDVFRLDLLIEGRLRHRPDAPRIWLAIEISSVVDLHDVKRAQRRADALRRAGYRAIPTVAGERATVDGEKAASASNVLLIRDGQARFWEDALKAAMAY